MWEAQFYRKTGRRSRLAKAKSDVSEGRRLLMTESSSQRWMRLTTLRPMSGILALSEEWANTLGKDLTVKIHLNRRDEWLINGVGERHAAIKSLVVVHNPCPDYKVMKKHRRSKTYYEDVRSNSTEFNLTWMLDILQGTAYHQHIHPPSTTQASCQNTGRATLHSVKRRDSGGKEDVPVMTRLSSCQLLDLQAGAPSYPVSRAIYPFMLGWTWLPLYTNYGLSDTLTAFLLITTLCEVYNIANSPKGNGTTSMDPSPDPVLSAPTTALVNELDEWEKDEAVAKNLLLSKIPDSVAMKIQHLPTVAVTWAKIEKEFTDKSGYAQT
ncbi:uncharacterized protein EV420DRAFT_1489358 [Desarmillaria tabescens]|uniref:Uncharacterized protein n=1 Tax=Armillaria tabescens TaxID=1929756 RepID=A0AA39MGU4_ARMTA|nr:uncharacterized protein EV420DRAFT_1489358 [Desarmillaria tabescens]KAK0433219.1 hypothetical protein EV420DRAFT_1489358 [Desarmillaria tabescens]